MYGDSVNEATWSGEFRELFERGLKDMHYVVSDNHQGLRNAIDRHSQGVIWQRCQVHFIRNVLAQVKKKDRGRVLELLREITESSTLERAKENLERAIDDLELDYPEVAEFLECQAEETLAVY